MFDRLEEICELKKLKGIPELAQKLGYKSSEKIYRLKRTKASGKYNSPSFEIILDLSNLFADLNLRWLITGIGDPFPGHYKINEEYYVVNEPEERIRALEIENKTLLKVIKELSVGHHPNGDNVGLKKLS